MRIFMKITCSATAAGVLLFFGCRSNVIQSAPTAVEPPTHTSTIPSTSQTSRDARQHLIYLDYTEQGQTVKVNIYSEKNPLTHVASIGKPIVYPEHMAVDVNGNVYIANAMGAKFGQGEIDIYAPGKTTPAKVLQVQNPFWAYGVCVRGGITYGVTWGPSTDGPWPVYEYAHGSSTPTSIVYKYPNDHEPKACTIDSHGNLYVLYYTPSNAFIDEFAPGSHTPQTLGISLFNGLDIEIDAGDDLIVSGSATNGGPEAVFVFPPGQIVPSKSIDSGGNPWGVALSSDGKTLYVVDVCHDHCTKSSVYMYDYQSGNMIGSFPGGGNQHSVFFVAVSPRAPL
jgi:DNA-binding beta-propeller fold protein YncE